MPFAAVHESGSGTTRRFAAVQQVVGYRRVTGRVVGVFGTAALVTGFGCRPHGPLQAHQGRRPKAARERKRVMWGTRCSGFYGYLVGADSAACARRCG